NDKIAYLANIDRCRDFGLVTVYGLNYDMCFEAALQSINRTCINGFENGVWSPMKLQTEQEVRYLKLHGSLDWVDDAEFGICSLEYPAHPEASEMIGQRPLVIFGTESKMTAKEPFLSQLHHFSHSLDNCNVLVIIGYSFGDKYMNELIQQRFSTNTVMHVCIVVPTDIGEVLADCVPALHDSPRVTHLKLTARDALQNNHLYQAVGRRLTSAQEESPFGVDD
ncbi:MAG: SIR2 family protein, partial [Armatimonadota bacterium]